MLEIQRLALVIMFLYFSFTSSFLVSFLFDKLSPTFFLDLIHLENCKTTSQKTFL
jgi:hypothetical protein